MEDRRFIALGDLIADCYYNQNKLVGIDGGSSRFNVIANLAHMNCPSTIIGGCGNDKTGELVIKRMEKMGIDISKIVIRDRATRAYHLTINQETLPLITYQCSRVSPKSGISTWYEESLEDLKYYHKEIKNTDVIVLDMLNEFWLTVINEFYCDKLLDIGNTNMLNKLQDYQISIIKDKLEILQLNESVVPYLMKRFKCNNILEIYEFFKPKLLIVTRAKDGADFVYGNSVCEKKLLNSAEEIDATGAGDAFLSVFARNYYNNHKHVDDEFIYYTFKDAIELTSKVVQYIGARGHLYERTISNLKQEEKTLNERAI